MPKLSEKASVTDFETLGLNPETHPPEVKKAYRDLVKRWHPDRFQQRTVLERRRAEERFKEITGAYRRISAGWKYQGRSAEGKKEKGTDESRNSVRPERPSCGAGGSRKPVDSPPLYTCSMRVFSALATWQMRLRSRLSGKRRSVAAFGVCALLAIAAAFFVLFDRPTTDLSRSFMETRPQMPARSTDLAVKNAQPEDAPPIEPKGTAPVHPQPPIPPGPHSPQQRDASGQYFTLGSTSAEVLRIQGPPSRTHGQIWVYGLSEVQFKEGRVSRYNNFDNSLKVRLHSASASQTDSPSFFTLGSTQNEVLLVQGTPTRVETNKWFYGFSEIRFKNGRVEDYDNYFGNLKIRILPSIPVNSRDPKGFFSLGSTQDEVLAIQGTPTSIQGNFWFYQLSNVLFRDGKVQYVVNSGDNLRYVPPEDVTKKDRESE